MGPLSGKRILDIGAGLGESSVYFALQGASVTCTDLSPHMVQRAVELGRFHGVEIDGVVSAAETLNVSESSYDFVYIANTIHHVTKKESLFEQMHLRACGPAGSSSHGIRSRTTPSSMCIAKWHRRYARKMRRL